MKKITALLLLFYSITCSSQSVEKLEDTNIYNTAGLDVQPEFPGGLDKLNAIVNESYLKAGFASEVKGKIYAMFVIEKDGSLSDVKLLRRVDPPKASALIQILKTLPKWNPAKQNGKVVRVLFYSVPLVIGS